ncbi:hypothetical protein BU14_0471s0006 [Porphyra umbilicalis]|uniref:Uncharacterized protein n=1 Tax=Porphyra umbilicalis TaxID=2786 RepID=A0A1X6NU08_PORUM|nr:hypothetical protein BU14_0471s0006 [Porphyra umbilicalis]|eukprot:OSX72067.1 hypothetical protein BU14_0471s0006 [Porphyra umbilicalis]
MQPGAAAASASPPPAGDAEVSPAVMPRGTIAAASGVGGGGLRRAVVGHCGGRRASAPSRRGGRPLPHVADLHKHGGGRGGKRVPLAVVTNAEVVMGGSGRRRSARPRGWEADSRGGVVGPRWPSWGLALDASDRRQRRRHLQWEARRDRHGVDREDGVAGSENNAQEKSLLFQKRFRHQVNNINETQLGTIRGVPFPRPPTKPACHVHSPLAADGLLHQASHPPSPQLVVAGQRLGARPVGRSVKRHHPLDADSTPVSRPHARLKRVAVDHGHCHTIGPRRFHARPVDGGGEGRQQLEGVERKRRHRSPVVHDARRGPGLAEKNPGALWGATRGRHDVIVFDLVGDVDDLVGDIGDLFGDVDDLVRDVVGLVGDGDPVGVGSRHSRLPLLVVRIVGSSVNDEGGESDDRGLNLSGRRLASKADPVGSQPHDHHDHGGDGRGNKLGGVDGKHLKAVAARLGHPYCSGSELEHRRQGNVDDGEDNGDHVHRGDG